MKQNVRIEGNIECVYPAGDLKTCESYTKLTCNGGKGEMLPAYWTPGAKHTSGGAGDDDEDISYSPSKGVWGSYAFEDLWPYVGDYDMNDAVLDYQVVYHHPKGTDGNLVGYIEYNWCLRGAGTDSKISMGVQLDKIPAGNIASVANSHTKVANGPIEGGAGGLEPGQSKAVFVLFNDPEEIYGAQTFINTVPGNPPYTPVKFTVRVDFKQPVPKKDIVAENINVFLVVSPKDSPDRGKEIHLKGFPATDKADIRYSVLGFAGGPENPYVANNGLIWGIHFPQRFLYPQERRTISTVYKHYEQWYSSGGVEYEDWYEDKAGYRDEAALYPLLEPDKAGN